MAGAEADQDASGGSERRRWWRLYAVLALAAAAWSLGVPLMTGHDEVGQSIRAAAVARGEVLGVPVPGWLNTVVRVHAPEAYGGAARMGNCFLGRPYDPLFVGMPTPPPGRHHCPTLDGGRRLAFLKTNQHRNPPAYPLVLGLPTLAFPDQLGAYLMRLVGVLVCTALLASGLVTVRRFRVPRLVALAALVVVTPEVIYLAGTSNTAGLETAASFALWTAALALALAPAEPDPRLVRRAGVALVALALARPMAPAFALVALAVAAYLAPPERRRVLWARRDVRRWLVAGGVAAATTLAWVVDLQIRFPVDAPGTPGLVDAIGRVPWWMRGMVGVFGSTDVIPPAGLHVLWGAALVAVLAWSVRRAPRRAGVVAIGLIVAAVLLLLSGSGLDFPDTGVWWQGRYVLPLVIGGVLTAAAAARPDGDGDRAPARWGPPLLVGLVGLQAWAFLYAVRHYAVGYGGTANPLRYLVDPDWSPPYGPDALYAAAFVAALAAVSIAVWRSAAPAGSPAEPAPDPAVAVAPSPA
jgi:hypothetical protein